MRVRNVPASAPFLHTVITALVDGELIEGFVRARSPNGSPRPRSICRPAAPAAWRAKSSSMC